MKNEFSIDIIKYNSTKRHKSSSDVQTLKNKKPSTDKTDNYNNKTIIEDNNKDKDKDNLFMCHHLSKFISFCEICSLDLCSECEEKHMNHKIIKYKDLIQNNEQINTIIKKYIDDYNKLIEEIYKWKKELDKKIFYFEEQIKNNSLINKNIEFILNFDFSQNNNYSSLSKYKKITDIITKPVNHNDINNNDDLSNSDVYVGCYSYQNYVFARQSLDKLKEYKNEEFILKSNDILKLIDDFLSMNKYLNKNEYKEEINNINSTINNETKENNKFFGIENNNIYTFSNTCSKENNINEINVNYLTNANNSKNDNNHNNNLKNENKSKSIGNIFLEDKKNTNNIENNNKYKKSIIKSSTLRRLNVINVNNMNNYKCDFNEEKKDESNSVNCLNKLNKKISEKRIINVSFHNTSKMKIKSNDKEIIDKYIPKIKKQNRVYMSHNTNSNDTNTQSNNLTTINSYNCINHVNKKNIYRHKKLNSMSISNYVNQSLPIEFNNFNNNNDIDKIATPNNSIGCYPNLINSISIDTIKNTYNHNQNKDRNNFAYNSNISPIYSLNTMEMNTNHSPPSFYSSKDNKSIVINNRRNNIKNKFLTKNLTHANYNTIIETPITFVKNSLIKNNTRNNIHNSNNNHTDYNISQNDKTNKEFIYNENNANDANDKILIDSTKNLYVGLELGNAECRIGFVNQNNHNKIELFEFNFDNNENKENIENKDSIPTIISFDSKSNEIKIGNDAINDMLNNPSQTIFNIVKIIGKSYKQINNDIDLWPYKLYYNEDLCRPYVKINYNKQKNRIFFFEDLLSIFLKKLFELFFAKIKLINKKSNTDINVINLILVVTVSNNYNYLQRKIIEKIFQTQIFPVNKDVNSNNIFYDNNNMNSNNNMNKNKKKVNLYSGYTILLKDIKIENGSSIATLSLFNKIKIKNDSETIVCDKNDKINHNNNKFKINVLNNNDEIMSNNTDCYSCKQISPSIKGRESINSINKQRNSNLNNKNILVINVDGGFTNISLANISQSKPKEKNNSKPKNYKNIKKNNSMNILEIKELSGNEYGEEDFVDVYINDCLKQLEENIYKECLKSPNK